MWEPALHFLTEKKRGGGEERSSSKRRKRKSSSGEGREGGKAEHVQSNRKGFVSTKHAASMAVWPLTLMAGQEAQGRVGLETGQRCEIPHPCADKLLPA